MATQIDDVMRQHGASLIRQAAHYHGAAHKEGGFYHGYVAFKNVFNNLTGRYNVIIPRMNNALLTDVPVVTSSAQANGVGVLGPALRPGQPVIVRFNDKTSTQPYIDGSFFLVGNVEDYQDKPPSIDDKHSRTGRAINPPPMTPHSLSVGGEAAVEVHPMLVREFSPVHPSSPAAHEIPGLSITNDSFGNTTRIVPGQSIEVLTKSSIQETLGADGSIVDASLKRSMDAFKRTIGEWWKQDQYYATYDAGVYKVQGPHPKIEESEAALSRDPDKVGGLNRLSKFLDESMGFLTRDLQLIVRQVKYIISTYQSMSVTVKALWGEEPLGVLSSGAEKLPDLSVGDILSFLPPDINAVANQAVQFYSTLATYIDGLPPIPGVAGDSGTIVSSLSPRVQKLQTLRAEAEILFGAISSLINLVALATKKGKSLTPLPEETPEQTIVRVRQLLVEEESTCFPITPVALPITPAVEASPVTELSNTLTLLGVPNSVTFVESLQNLVAEPNVISFLGAVSASLPPNIQLVTTVVSAQLGAPEDVAFVLEELRARTDPTSSFCGDLAQEFYSVSDSSVLNPSVESDLSFMYSYLFVPPLNLPALIDSPSYLVNWLRGLNQPDAADRAQTLLEGDLVNFVSKTVQHHSGVDLDIYPSRKQALSEQLQGVLRYSAEGMPV